MDRQSLFVRAARANPGAFQDAPQEGGGSYDIEQQRQLLLGVNKLNQMSSNLERAYNLGQETEQVGYNILSTLGDQTGQLRRVRDTVRISLNQIDRGVGL